MKAGSRKRKQEQSLKEEVFEAALAVLNSGQPELLNFGVSKDMAWSVGLSCGGRVKVFVEALT